MASNARPPQTWNRAEVSRYLVPFLQMAQAMRQPTDATPADNDWMETDLAARKRMAKSALYACPSAYRQLSRVYHRADDATFESWFGGIDCDDALLAAAFDLIDRALAHMVPATVTDKPGAVGAAAPSSVAHTTSSATPSASEDADSAEPLTAQPSGRSESLTEDSAFRKLFRISHTYTDTESGKVRVRHTDLLLPFLEFCRASNDAERRRAEELCLGTVGRYLSDYLHALTYYRESYADPDSDAYAMLLSETHLCMQLLEQTVARTDYERTLAQQKAALQYERGGLGWFGGARKRSIDTKLRDISICELQLALEDERARLDTVLSPLQQQLENFEDQLARAPMTAFRRKKELRTQIAQLEQQIEQEKKQSRIKDLTAQLNALQAKQTKSQRKKMTP
jgi:hypothetical protein